MSALRKYQQKNSIEPERRRISTIAVMHGSHLLMGKRRDNSKWTVPGGHANDGEDFHTAAMRELEEESGIKATHHDITPLGKPHIVTKKDGEKIEVSPFKY